MLATVNLSTSVAPLGLWFEWNWRFYKPFAPLGLLKGDRKSMGFLSSPLFTRSIPTNALIVRLTK